MDALVRQWREDTPGCANQIHFNNAASGLMPRAVLEAITAHLNREANLGGYESADDAEAAVEDAYAAVAKVLGAQPRNIAVVENSTVAFFQALSAFDFKDGDVIVTTRNDYISNQLAYLSLARRHGVEVRRAADLAGGGADPQSVKELSRSARTLAGGHLGPDQLRPDAAGRALGEVAEAAGVPYLVDGCQAVGQIPVDVAKLRCDFFSGAARKFLRGPRGIGFLYVSDRALKRGDFPLYIDMRGADWVSADSFAPAPDARRFENWEFAYSLVLGLGEAARYALGVDVKRGGPPARDLAAARRSKLAAIGGIRVLDRGRDLAAIVTIEVAGWDAGELSKLLRARGINSSASLRAYAVIDMDEKRAATALRLSPHYYNTEEELDRVVEELKTVTARGRAAS